MSALLPISHVQIVLKNLNPLEVAAIEAGKGIKIKDYGLENLFSRISNIVKEAVQIRGEKMAELDQGKLTQLLTEELKQSFSTFTVEEIGQAVHAWAAGKIYEEGKHVSVHNICKAIWHWRDSVKREALDKIRKEEEAREKEVSEEKKKELTEVFKKDLLDTWNEYQTRKELAPDLEYYHAAMYEHLEKIGYTLTTEIKKRIWQESAPPPPKDHIPSVMIHDFKRGQELAQKQRAKAAALKFVFDWLINNGKELELN